MRKTKWLVLFSGLAGLIWSCKSTDANRPAPPPAASAPAVAPAPAVPPHEASVRPGVNKEYLGEIDVSKWVERFETESREIFRERGKIVALAGIKPGQTVADIGAGTGLFTALFSRAVEPGGRVFAVDIAPAFLEHITARAKEDGLTNIQTVLCKEDSVELPPASVDVVFICDTYHHFEYPQSTLRSIYAALKPEGRMVLIDFERIEGVTQKWILEHVRAGKEQVIVEVRLAGFELVKPIPAADFLQENYCLVFRKARP